MAYTTIDKPANILILLFILVMVLLYLLQELDFQPDFFGLKIEHCWFKHFLSDTVRGDLKWFRIMALLQKIQIQM
jgi:hypothetical protein